MEIAKTPHDSGLQQEQYVIIDTSAIMEVTDIIDRAPGIVHIPLTVIKQLDGLKKNKAQEVNRKARLASKSIEDNTRTGKVVVLKEYDDKIDGLANDNDNKIVGAAVRLQKEHPGAIVTLWATDRNMRITASSHGISAPNLEPSIKKQSNRYSSGKGYGNSMDGLTKLKKNIILNIVFIVCILLILTFVYKTAIGMLKGITKSSQAVIQTIPASGEICGPSPIIRMQLNNNIQQDMAYIKSMDQWLLKTNAELESEKQAIDTIQANGINDQNYEVLKRKILAYNLKIELRQKNSDAYEKKIELLKTKTNEYDKMMDKYNQCESAQFTRQTQR